MTGPHHRGQYQQAAARVRARAYANPDTRCWRCGLRLHDHAPHRNGTPARWTAGHVIDGLVGGPLLPESSTCNTSAGAAYGNRRRRPIPTSRPW